MAVYMATACGSPECERRRLRAREGVPDRAQAGIPEVPAWGSSADVFSFSVCRALRNCPERRRCIYSGRWRRGRASRRADGRTCPGRGRGHQQRQHAAIDSAGYSPARIASLTRRDDIAGEVARLTGGQGVDVVFDATYSESGFVESAKTVREGGTGAVLCVGPGKTTRLVETESPVDSMLAERGAKHINVNILRYFSDPVVLDDKAKAFLQRGITLAIESTVQGKVVPYIGKTIESSVEAINDGLQLLKSGRGR
jgi:hypothetical protein